MRLMNTPKSVDILFTNKCNLSCKYCSDFKEEQSNDLPICEWTPFVEELGRCTVLNVGIGGGEPFIRTDLYELINSIAQNRMRFTMASNGTLISDEVAERIASTGRCDSIQISIDGSYPQPHDVFRGDGSFQKAISGIKSLRKHGIPVGVRVTIHRHNVYDLEEIAHFLMEDLRLPGFSTNAASYLGLCRDNSEEIQLTVEERSYAMEVLLRLSKKYRGRIDASAGPLAEAKHWIEMENARKEKKQNLSDCGFLRSCGGVFTKMAVKANGTMIPCSQMGHIELGRINQDDLTETWQNHPELVRLRERVTIPLETFEFCQGCEYIPYCRGNCPALAYTITGEENHPSPDACLKRFLEVGGRVPGIRQ